MSTLYSANISISRPSLIYNLFFGVFLLDWAIRSDASPLVLPEIPSMLLLFIMRFFYDSAIDGLGGSKKVNSPVISSCTKLPARN